VRVLDGNLRLIIEMPPRSGKTELVSRAFPAWLLGVRPDWQVILASYESDFAAEHGAKARDLLAEYGPTLFGVRVNTASNARDRWDMLGTPGAEDSCLSYKVRQQRLSARFPCKPAGSSTGCAPPRSALSVPAKP
jgi:hypothetical protein